MNKQWVDKQIDFLSLKLGIFRADPNTFFFEPTDAFYENLQSGDERDLQSVVNDISQMLQISPIPSTIYEWGLKMEPSVAGEIRAANRLCQIRIPLFYVGKKFALGAIIAHEMSHAFLFSRGISLEDNSENEMLTDLTSIYIGLGKLLINGIYNLLHENSDEGYTLSYLEPELLFYAYKKINEYRSLNTTITNRNLTSSAVEILMNNR